MGEARYPRKDTDFSIYITTAIAYLNTHAARLGVAPGNLADLNLLFTDPAGEGWDVIFPMSQNIAERTTTITAKKDTLREEITDLLRIIYLDIPESALTQLDRDTLLIFEKDDTPTPRPQITTAPAVDLKMEDGSIVLISCKVQSDASRASMHPAADVIEMRYCFDRPADPAPALADCTNVELSSKALFRFDAGNENVAKRMHAYLRYRNNSEPEKSGPWTQVHTIVISD